MKSTNVTPTMNDLDDKEHDNKYEALIEEIERLKAKLEQLENLNNALASENAFIKQNLYSRVFSDAERLKSDTYNHNLNSNFKSEGDMKYELIRIANSKWGSRAIKLVFKLKIHKLFK